MERLSASRACSVPDNIKMMLADSLLSGQHEVSFDTDRLERLTQKLDESAAVDDAPRADRASPGDAIVQKFVDGYVKVMAKQERDAADEQSSKWVYREALPFCV